MKNLVLTSLLLLSLVFQGQAQDVLFEAKLKKQDVPDVVVEAIEEDYPDFSIVDVAAVPIEFVGEDVIINKLDKVNNKDYQTFKLKLEGKGREVEVTYDKEGHLKNSYENLNDIPLPENIAKKIGEKYPGWAITKDNFKLIHYSDKTPVERYKIVLSKGNDKKKVYYDANGNFIKES